MTRRWIPGRTTHVGIALSADRLIAVLPGDSPATPWTRPLTPTGDPAVTWPDLAEALGALHEAVDGTKSGRALHVALLPPLGELRRVELPGLSLAEARQVLRREPSRYLARAADSAPVELEVEGEGWRQSSPFTLLAASRAIVEGIHAAAQQTGWRLAGTVAAEGAWGAAASLLPAKDDAERALLICLEDRVELVRVSGGHVLTVRRFPVDANVVTSQVRPLLRGADDSSRASVAVVGDSPLAEELRLTLDTPGTSTQRDAGPGAWHDSPALLAARFSTRASGPVLLPESERALLAHDARRANVVRFAAAAAFLAAAAGVELWGLSREHDAIVAERARLREPVTRALAVRDSLGEVGSRLATIRAASASSPRWAPLLVALSERLPDDAFLVSLRADRDSLRLEGEAARAEGVFDALRGVRGFSALRPDGPIRQEIAEDGSTSERFTLSAPVVREP